MSEDSWDDAFGEDEEPSFNHNLELSEKQDKTLDNLGLDSDSDWGISDDPKEESSPAPFIRPNNDNNTHIMPPLNLDNVSDDPDFNIDSDSGVESAPEADPDFLEGLDIPSNMPTRITERQMEEVEKNPEWRETFGNASNDLIEESREVFYEDWSEVEIPQGAKLQLSRRLTEGSQTPRIERHDDSEYEHDFILPTSGSFVLGKQIKGNTTDESSQNSEDDFSDLVVNGPLHLKNH